MLVNLASRLTPQSDGWLFPCRDRAKRRAQKYWWGRDIDPTRVEPLREYCLARGICAHDICMLGNTGCLEVTADKDNPISFLSLQRHWFDLVMQLFLAAFVLLFGAALIAQGNPDDLWKVFLGCMFIFCCIPIFLLSLRRPGLFLLMATRLKRELHCPGQ